MRFAKTISSACLAAFVGLVAFADESGEPAQNRDAVLDTIAQINHINWVVNVIKSYNNVIVLEEEYEKISPGNLYLDRIPDEETLGRITKMLDTLYSLRKDDRQMKKWRMDFRESRDRKIRDHKHKATKEAVDTITGQVKECCSLWDWATNPLGSIANVVGTAFNMAHYSVGLHNDYDNFVYELDKTAKDRQFDFDGEKLDLLHNQNKEILQDQWQFIRRYKLDDRLRVSDVDIKMLLNCLKNDNPAWIFTRLYPMRERFSLFPEYWYYLSCAAMETGHFKEGLEACDTFFRVNRGLFRDDPMVGTVAFNKAFMLPKTKENKPEVRRCLELAWTKNANVTHPDWQLDYLAAIMYKGVFDEKEKAEMMFEHAIALIEQESRERTRYGGKAGVTLDEGLRNCRNALRQLRGEPIEVEPSSGETKTITLPGGATMEMIYVAPGSFMMGSPSSEEGRDDDETQHRVTLTKGFWLGKYEVTQAQWQSVMGSNPSYFKSPERPVENVSWNDCQEFVRAVNVRVKEQLGGNVRLPTEAEWEYACRGGTDTSLPSGQNLVVLGESNGRGLNEISWYSGNSSVAFELSNGIDCSGLKEKEFSGSFAGTHPVGKKDANKWGFHDMIGNVLEWCEDTYDKDYYSIGPAIDPCNRASGDYRVLRGGSWDHFARSCRSAYRLRDQPGNRGVGAGFRLCCSAGPRGESIEIKMDGVDGIQKRNMLTDAEKAEGWKLAWDGKTFDGWLSVKSGCKEAPSKGWFIKDGTLTMRPVNGIANGGWFPLPLEEQKLGGGGDIVTAKKYRDFAFKFCFRLTENAKSGVKYFYDENLNKGTCEGYQVIENGHPDSDKGKNGNRKSASLYDIIPANADSILKGPGEWNSGMIVAKGAHVEHWLNGVKVLEYDRGTPAFKAAVKASKYADWGIDANGKPQDWGEIPEGRILLQDHSDSIVSFCNLKIKEL